MRLSSNDLCVPSHTNDVKRWNKFCMFIAILVLGSIIILCTEIIDTDETNAENFTVEGIDYETGPGLTAKVCGCDKSKSGDIIIPPTIEYHGKTYSITTIEEYAFSGCQHKTSVIIPESITSIGRSAFYYCKSLTAVTIPNSITTLSNSIFKDCTSITFVTIPKSVITIGSSAFEGCKSLASITIPDSITTISSSAFRGCTGLLSIDIPGNIKSINESTFRNCTGLLSINIPKSVTSIGYSAFRECKSLSSITIPNSVTSIKESAFEGCKSLASITIPDSITSIGDYAFFACTSVSTLVIGKCVKEFGILVFASCTALTSVTIPKSVKITEDRGLFPDCTFYDFNGKKKIGDDYKLPGYRYIGETSSKLIRHDLNNVTFDRNGGSEKIEGMNIKEGKEFVLPKYAGTKKGHTFAGWSYNGVTYPSGETMIKTGSDMKFTAVWEINRYKAVFRSHGNDFSHLWCDYGSVITAPKEVPVLDPTAQYEYIFSYWSGFSEEMIITEDISFEAVFKGILKKIDTSKEKIIINGKDIEDITVTPEMIDLIKSAGRNGKSMELILSNGKITLDSASLTGLPEGKKEISLFSADRSKIPTELNERIGDRPVYSINFSDLHEFSGLLSVSVKYELKEGENTKNLCIWSLKDDGTYEKMECRYSDGYAMFNTTHLSDYAIMVEELGPSGNGSEFANQIVAGAIAELLIIAIVAPPMIRKRQ